MKYVNGYLDMLAWFGIGGAHPGGLALTKEVLQRIKIRPETHIIDIGCGTGQTAAYLKKTFQCKVTALDRNKLMLEKAKQRFAKEKLNIELMEGDTECLPLEKNSFDIIIAESVTIFTDIKKTIQEYARVLRPGGVLLDIELAATSPLDDKGEFHSFYQIRKLPTEKEWIQSYLQADFKSIQILREGKVSTTLNSNIQHLDAIPDLLPSTPMDPSYFELSIRHSMLMHVFSHQLKYCVFQMEKG